MNPELSLKFLRAVLSDGRASLHTDDRLSAFLEKNLPNLTPEEQVGILELQLYITSESRVNTGKPEDIEAIGQYVLSVLKA